eukprot:6284722-Prymnesium_polylepis.1
MARTTASPGKKKVDAFAEVLERPPHTRRRRAPTSGADRRLCEALLRASSVTVLLRHASRHRTPM